MNNAESVVVGMAIGAGLVYFLDPDRGTRRRALVRDQLVHAGHELEAAAGAGARHARNRGLGLAHEAKAGLLERDVDDRVLEERVRSAFGRTVSHPGTITVTADRGTVTLTGDVPTTEVQELVQRVRSVRGVQHVENRLSAHTRTESVPGLQGADVRS